MLFIQETMESTHCQTLPSKWGENFQVLTVFLLPSAAACWREEMKTDNDYATTLSIFLRGAQLPISQRCGYDDETLAVEYCLKNGTDRDGNCVSVHLWLKSKWHPRPHREQQSIRKCSCGSAFDLLFLAISHGESFGMEVATIPCHKAFNIFKRLHLKQRYVLCVLILKRIDKILR